MTKIFTLLFVLCFFGLNAQVLYDDFDNQRQVTYGLNIPFPDQQGNEIGGLEWPGWHGVLLQYWLNPLPDAVNDSHNCAQYNRNPSETYDVIIVDNGLMADLSSYVAGEKQMSLDVFSPYPGITVQITLENKVLAGGPYPEGRHSEYTAVTTTGAEWETLTFSYVQTPDGSLSDDSIDQMVLLFNPGVNLAETYYFDNLYGPELQEPNCTEFNTDVNIINDADCDHNSWKIDYYDGRMSIFPNPSPDGTNDSNNCIEYARNGGVESDVIVGSFNEALDLSSGSTIFMDTYDLAAPSTVTLSIQDEFGNVLQDVSSTTTNSNVWETLVFDFSSISVAPNATNFVLLYKPGLFEAETFYFDNVYKEFVDSVEENDQSIELTAYPNPVNDLLTVSFADFQVDEIEIINVLGQTVSQTFNVSKGTQIDVSSLDAGIYTVRATSANKTASIQVVKQ